MIPSEVAAIASLIWPGWADLPVDETNEILAAAFRIYEAGYKKEGFHDN